MKLLLALLLPLFASGAEATLILHHGKIVTADSKFSIVEAIAVQGNRIIATGPSDAVLRDYRGKGTELIDLKGKMVLPGLTDAHVHALWSGQSEFRGKLPPLDSYAAIQSYIRDQAAKTPKGQWIIVPRTFPTRLKEMRMPTREVLDVAPEHPVVFDASYVLVLNSKGLQVCGITRGTPNPPGGEIGKRADGEPNGILRNAMAMVKGVDVNGSFTHDEKLKALEDQLHRYRAAGLTAIGDRAVTAEDIGLYNELHIQNRLPLRVVLTWRINASRPTDDLVAEIRNAPYTTNTGDDWLKFGTFKVTLDGGMTIGTAYQREPYGEFGKQLYGGDAGRGQLFIEPEKLFVIFRTAREKGWQLTAHDVGGGAIDNLLDAFEKLPGIAASRSHSMHANFQNQASIARTKKLGILVDAQPAWLEKDGPALAKVFGYDKMTYFLPLKSLMDAGVTVAGGSDHMIGHDKDTAVNPYNPFRGMWTAVTRRMHDGQVMHPEQRISREQALRMYTTAPAYLQFSEDVRGSIEKGKFADLVVIDRDYLTCPEEQIKDIQPVLVVVDGKPTTPASK